MSDVHSQDYEGPERRERCRRCNDCPVTDENFDSKCEDHEHNSACIKDLVDDKKDRKKTATTLLTVLIPLGIVIIGFGWRLAIRVEQLTAQVVQQGQAIEKIGKGLEFFTQTLIEVKTKQEDMSRRLDYLEGRKR